MFGVNLHDPVLCICERDLVNCVGYVIMSFALVTDKVFLVYVVTFFGFG